MASVLRCSRTLAVCTIYTLGEWDPSLGGSDSLGVKDGAEQSADDDLQRGDLHGGEVGKVLLKRFRFLQQGKRQKYKT